MLAWSFNPFNAINFLVCRQKSNTQNFYQIDFLLDISLFWPYKYIFFLFYDSYKLLANESYKSNVDDIHNKKLFLTRKNFNIFFDSNSNIFFLMFHKVFPLYAFLFMFITTQGIMAKIKIKWINFFYNFFFVWFSQFSSFYLKKNCFYVSNFPLRKNIGYLKRVMCGKRELRWQKWCVSPTKLKGKLWRIRYCIFFIFENCRTYVQRGERTCWFHSKINNALKILWYERDDASDILFRLRISNFHA